MRHYFLKQKRRKKKKMQMIGSPRRAAKRPMKVFDSSSHPETTTIVGQRLVINAYDASYKYRLHTFLLKLLFVICSEVAHETKRAQTLLK